jgi:acetyl-CoA synthetase
MRPLPIRKSPADSPSLAPGSEFSWPQVGHELGLSANGHLNIAALAVDRHAHSARADRTAFRFLGADGNTRNVSYRELAELTDRFGNALKSLGVVKGDCVFVLCDRVCALYVAVLGALKVGAVVSPLFQSFGPEPIRNRIAQAAGKVLVTSSSLYQRRVASLRAEGLKERRDHSAHLQRAEHGDIKRADAVAQHENAVAFHHAQ